MRRTDRECLWRGEKTDEATKGDEDAKLRWLDCLTSEVPQSVGVALVVEMNRSLSAKSILCSQIVTVVLDSQRAMNPCVSSLGREPFVNNGPVVVP